MEAYFIKKSACFAYQWNNSGRTLRVYWGMKKSLKYTWPFNPKVHKMFRSIVTNLEKAKRVTGGQHPLNEIHWVQESLPWHVIDLVMQIRRQVQSNGIVQFIGPEQKRTFNPLRKSVKTNKM